MTTGSSSSPSPSSTAKEPKPSHLNTLNSSGLFQLVSTDKMSVQYVDAQLPQHQGHDVGTAQADCPAPTKKTAYYFEMTVRNAGDKGQVTIGFTGKHCNLRRQPGFASPSILASYCCGCIQKELSGETRRFNWYCDGYHLV